MDYKPRSCVVNRRRPLLALAVAACACIANAGCLSMGTGGTATASANPTPGEKQELAPAKSAQVQLTVADNLEKGGHDLEALAYYEKARANDPRLDVSKRVAGLYDRLGDSKRAVEEYQVALKANPRDANLINSYGYFYYSRGQWKQAEEQFRLALSINPNMQRAWINLGLALGEQDRYEESLEAFTKVVSKAEGLSNLGFVLMTQGKKEDAKQAYREAIRLDPNLRIAQVSLQKLENSNSSGSTGRTPPTLNP